MKTALDKAEAAYLSRVSGATFKADVTLQERLQRILDTVPAHHLEILATSPERTALFRLCCEIALERHEKLETEAAAATARGALSLVLKPERRARDGEPIEDDSMKRIKVTCRKAPVYTAVLGTCWVSVEVPDQRTYNVIEANTTDEEFLNLARTAIRYSAGYVGEVPAK